MRPSAPTHRKSRREDHGRRLVLIDMENYCGKPALTPDDVGSARSRMESTLGIGNRDLFVIGTSHTSNYISAKTAWPGAEHVLRTGHNGADIALIEAARLHFRNLGTFREVLMLSGDGIFTTLVSEIRERGVPTTVVAPRGQLNRSLSAVSPCVVFDWQAGLPAAS